MSALPEDWLPDAARVLVITSYALLMGQTLAVLWFYYLARRSLRRSRRGKTPGLLLGHVILISASYFGLGTLAFLRAVENAGEALSWRPFATFVFLVVGNVALWMMMRFQQYRRVRENQPVMAFHLPGETHVVDENPPFGVGFRRSRKP